VKLQAKRRHKETAHGDVWKQRFSVRRQPRNGPQRQHFVPMKRGKEC